LGLNSKPEDSAEEGEDHGCLAVFCQSSSSRVSIMVAVHALPSSNDLRERYNVNVTMRLEHSNSTLCLTLASSVCICATQGKLSLSVSKQNYVIANKSMCRGLQCFFHFLTNRPSEETLDTISAKERRRNSMIDFATYWINKNTQTNLSLFWHIQHEPF